MKVGECDADDIEVSFGGKVIKQLKSNHDRLDQLAELGEAIRNCGGLTSSQLDLIDDAQRRYAERRNAKLAKSRQSLRPQPGGPARRSGGRSYGTIGARYYGACARIGHIFEKLSEKKYGRAR